MDLEQGKLRVREPYHLLLHALRAGDDVRADAAYHQIRELCEEFPFEQAAQYFRFTAFTALCKLHRSKGNLVQLGELIDEAWALWHAVPTSWYTAQCLARELSLSVKDALRAGDQQLVDSLLEDLRKVDVVEPAFASLVAALTRVHVAACFGDDPERAQASFEEVLERVDYTAYKSQVVEVAINGLKLAGNKAYQSGRLDLSDQFLRRLRLVVGHVSQSHATVSFAKILDRHHRWALQDGDDARADVAMAEMQALALDNPRLSEVRAIAAVAHLRRARVAPDREHALLEITAFGAVTTSQDMIDHADLIWKALSLVVRQWDISDEERVTVQA